MRQYQQNEDRNEEDHIPIPVAEKPINRPVEHPGTTREVNRLRAKINRLEAKVSSLEASLRMLANEVRNRRR